MSEPTNELATAADVIGKIPAHWRNAEIFLASNIGSLTQIKRVSLQRNASGRRVVLLHPDDFSK
jgi:hypothetical protein